MPGQQGVGWGMVLQLCPDTGSRLGPVPSGIGLRHQICTQNPQPFQIKATYRHSNLPQNVFGNRHVLLQHFPVELVEGCVHELHANPHISLQGSAEIRCAKKPCPDVYLPTLLLPQMNLPWGFSELLAPCTLSQARLSVYLPLHLQAYTALHAPTSHSYFQEVTKHV